MKKKSILALCMIFILGFCSKILAQEKEYHIQSPDKHIRLNVKLSEGQVKWEITKDDQILLTPSLIDIQINGQQLGQTSTVRKSKITTNSSILETVVPIKSREIDNSYQQLELHFKDHAIQFRAYNDGVAYRYLTQFKKTIRINEESIQLNFPADYRVFWSNEANKQFLSHFESLYTDSTISHFGPDRHAALPLLVQHPSGVNLLISETELLDYPNLFLFGTGKNSLVSGHPKVILESDRKGDRGFIIKKEADYIAETKGTRAFPWRTITIASTDKELLTSQLNYKLASPSRLPDTDWIKPGKVAWDWWNANTIYGVDFKSGVNTETYKYFIDFASQFGLEYILLDEGWTKSTTDLKHSSAKIDIEEIINYAGSKNIGVWLWCLWEPLDLDMEHILDQYAAWGAKGIKVDFMARADQYMVNYYERVAKACADRKLMVNFHGAFKPVGLHHLYPNVMTYEGVRGLENNKWENTITPTHNLTLPFTRMVAGPMDYTPGAMKNVVTANFHPAFTAPMSMGTRAHQAAMYVLYESPLQMLADSPSAYLADKTYTSYIAQIPTVWDETVPLEAKIGEYAVIARRHGTTWYVSAMADWNGKELELSLPFADGTSFDVEILQDGINSDTHPSDYKIVRQQWNGKDNMAIKIMPGGGWVGIFKTKAL